MMKKDIIIINFKTYKESTGNNALKLVKKLEKVIIKNNVIKKNIIIVPQTVDIRLLKNKTKIPIFAQHADLQDSGSYTGSINLDSLKSVGVSGLLINHSEKRISLKNIQKTIVLCKTKKIISVVCTRTLAETKKIIKFKPDYIAIEPPELIGGKISISQAKPQLIKNATSLSKIPVLCGAGIHKKEDVVIAKKLGASGILIASGIVKAKNIEKELKLLLDGFL